MSAYRLPLPYERPPLRRRASGLVLALCVNLGLLLILLTISNFTDKMKKASQGLVVDLMPQAHEEQETSREAEKQAKKSPVRPKEVPAPKPPPITLPVKPTIAAPKPAPVKPAPPLVEMSKDELAAADIANLPHNPGANAGDSKVVGTGPHGETLYAAEWAREPTSAELRGYLPSNPQDGFGIVACKTVAGNRVDDCVELEQEPRGSHLASAVRQAAWQFRVRPPRKNGVPLVGSWVSIRIDYTFTGRPD